MSKTVPSQNRVVLAGAITREKKPSSGKGASRFRLKGPYYYATSIGPQILRCPWQGYTGKFFAPGLGVGSSLPKFRHGGNKRKTVFRTGVRIPTSSAGYSAS
jgi:hypothetical protein